MTRIDIINDLIDHFNYQSYLEIGIADGYCWDRIPLVDKIGVDPEPRSPATFHMTSDAFFEKNDRNFDIILIDGLHESEQARKDVINALMFLNEGGTIVMHDCNPPNELCQRIPRETKEWTGDVWKAFVSLRNVATLSMTVFDCDWGVGIVRRGKQKPLDVEHLTYADLDKHRKKWLNLRDPKTFRAWLASLTS